MHTITNNTKVLSLKHHNSGSKQEAGGPNVYLQESNDDLEIQM